VRVEALLEHEELEVVLTTRRLKAPSSPMSACSTSRGSNKPSLDVDGLPFSVRELGDAALDSNEDKPVLRALVLLSKNCTDR
jgi:hypothetical protein